MRPIKDFANYFIEENGDVIGARGRVLKTDPNSTGYLRVTLSKNGKPTRRFVHQLVAETYLYDTYRDGLVVNHINGVRTDNRVSNLEYVTASYNVKDGFKRGRPPNNRYSREVMKLLGRYFNDGISAAHSARLLGLDRGTVAKRFAEFRERATTISKESRA